MVEKNTAKKNSGNSKRQTPAKPRKKSSTAPARKKDAKHKQLKHPQDKNPYRFVWIAIILVFFSVTMFLSEISYFSQWKYDADKIIIPLGPKIIGIQNDFGHIGAKVADMLVGQLFGVSALCIPLFILLIAITISNIPHISKKASKALLPTLFFTCLSTLFFGCFFGSNPEIFGTGLGGGMGIFFADIITKYVGKEGATILVIVLMILFFWIVAAKEFKWILGKITSAFVKCICYFVKAFENNKKIDYDEIPLDDTPEEVDSTTKEENAIVTGEDTTDNIKQTEEDKFENEVVKIDEPEVDVWPKAVTLDNGQVVAMINEDYYLFLRSDLIQINEEDKKSEEESLFVIKRRTVSENTDELSIIRNTEAEPLPEEMKTFETVVSDDKSEEKEEKKSEEGANNTIVIDDLTIAKNSEEKKVSDSDVNERTLYDPTAELSFYQKPTIELLKKYDDKNVLVNDDEVIRNKEQIVNTLATFGIKISQIEATVGPTVTLYEIKPAPGVRISKIQGLEKDIALALAALGIRIIAPIPGKGAIGIEVPNRNKAIVSMYSVIKSAKFHESKAELPIALGKTIQNETLVLDLAKMPHLLVAGATGQGKSVGLNAIITSLLYKKHPAELKFVMVDPKRLELTPYAALSNHFMAQMEGSDDIILTDTEKVIYTLNSLCKEMDDRYKLLEEAGVKNLKEYNDKFIHRHLNPEKGHRYLPYIVVIVDEFADLIMTAGREIETPIARIAQLARAAGIHMIIATQRPTTNIITGTIKANFPARIAFRVTSYIDSKTILGKAGADQLIGCGDMLVNHGSELIRVQCAFVDTPEVEAITKFIGVQHGYSLPYQLPEFQPETTSKDNYSGLQDSTNDFDPLLVEVARYVVDNQIGSASTIQRNFKIGFNRAGRIVDQMETLGIVGKQQGSKPRQVLIEDPVHLEHILDSIK